MAGQITVGGKVMASHDNVSDEITVQNVDNLSVDGSLSANGTANQQHRNAEAQQEIP